MAINAQQQSGTYLKQIACLSTQSMVEIKFSGQEIGEVVAVYPQISLSNLEISSGRANYGGRIICTVVYTDSEGKLCRIQKGAEFSHYTDDERLAPAQRGECVLKCERCQLKREGSSYVVAVVVGAKINVLDNAQRGYITSIEGANCKTDSGKLYSLINFSGESEVEDDFECVASDVLIPAANVCVTGCNVKTGLVEVSGEIYLSLLAVRDGSPVCLDRTVPFKCELSCDEALFNRRAYCRAEIASVNVNCKVNETQGKCNVGFEATLSFCGHFYEEEEIAYVSDAFSEECDLNLCFAEERVFADGDIKNYSERVQGPCAAKAKLDYTCAFLAATLPSAEFARTKGGIEGSVTATLLYEQSGEVHATEVNMPFSVTLAGLSDECKDISVCVLGMSLRQRSEGECEGEASLKITAADGEYKTIKYISEVTEGEKKTPCDCAVSVYVTEAGDGLWETAKKLCVCPESIQKSNPELAFPLTGKERIIIYRPKQG